MGRVACQTIAFGKGVCGTAALKAETQVVPNVEQWPGHIACDGQTKSEIVVPIVVRNGQNEKVVGVIDLDCEDLEGFDDLDREWLEKLAELLVRSCDW